MIVYRVGEGFQDAHGRAVDADGALLGAPDPGNLSAEGAAEAAAVSEGASDVPPAAAPKAKAAKKKGKK